MKFKILSRSVNYRDTSVFSGEYMISENTEIIFPGQNNSRSPYALNFFKSTKLCMMSSYSWISLNVFLSSQAKPEKLLFLTRFDCDSGL